MKIQLNARTVPTLALADGRAEEFFWDRELEGFALRLRRRQDGGITRNFVVQYRAGGRSRRLKLGGADRLSPTEARAAARKILGRVAIGGDPQDDKARRRRRAALTFRAVADAYLADRAGELRPTSLRINRLYLVGGDYFQPLHGLGIGEISHADIAARLSAIARARSSHTARAARRTINALFVWAMQEGWVAANPVIGTRKPLGAKARDRVLTDAELVAVWRACGDDDFGRIVRLLILLGSRRQEVGGIRSSEIDLGTGIWTLPAGRSKNKHPLAVQLPPLALEIIRAIPDRGRDHLFGDRAEIGFTAWSRGKVELDRRLGDSVAPFRLHDVRRSVATKLGEDLGVPPHVIEAALNHHSGFRRGVAGVYNRSAYAREVAAALARWSAHVIDLVEGRESKVVALQRA